VKATLAALHNFVENVYKELEPSGHSGYVVLTWSMPQEQYSHSGTRVSVLESPRCSLTFNLKCAMDVAAFQNMIETAHECIDPHLLTDVHILRSSALSTECVEKLVEYRSKLAEKEVGRALFRCIESVKKLLVESFQPTALFTRHKSMIFRYMDGETAEVAMLLANSSTFSRYGNDRGAWKIDTHEHSDFMLDCLNHWIMSGYKYACIRSSALYEDVTKMHKKSDVESPFTRFTTSKISETETRNFELQSFKRCVQEVFGHFELEMQE
jgi:hypothetical protein